MPDAPPAARIRWLIAALVLAITLGLLLSLIYATDAALSIVERVQRLPLWLGVLSTSLIVLVLLTSGWLLWRLLRPRRAPRAPVVAALTRAELETRLQSLPGAAPLQAELQELDRRAALDQVYVALFGEVSAGKSSLIAALVPGAEVRVDVRAGTTRSVRHYAGALGEDLRLMLADMPG